SKHRRLRRPLRRCSASASPRTPPTPRGSTSGCSKHAATTCNGEGVNMTKELATNVGLAFLAGFATSFGAFVAATPANPGFAALVAAASAAVYAGFRLAVGVLAAKAEKPLSVD